MRDNPYAVKCAGLFVLSGCALGALLGFGWSKVPERGRRG